MLLGQKPEGKHCSSDNDGQHQRADGQNSRQLPVDVLTPPRADSGKQVRPFRQIPRTRK